MIILELDMKGFFINRRRELIGKSFVNNIVPILLAATLASEFFFKASLIIKITSWALILALFVTGVAIYPGEGEEK
jgi:hypothetical protein